MTRRVAFFCLLAAVPAFVQAVSAAGSQPQRVQSDQEILIQLERDWDDAFHRQDVGFIENILADEFIATHGDGSRADKAEELALVAEFNQQVDSSRVDEFMVKVYGDTAVVWFTQHRPQPGADAGGDVQVCRRLRRARRPVAMRGQSEHESGRYGLTIGS